MITEQWYQLKRGDVIQAINAPKDIYLVVNAEDSEGVESETGRERTFRDLLCEYRGWEERDFGQLFELEEGEADYYQLTPVGK
jgi:hypothetical protein